MLNQDFKEFIQLLNSNQVRYLVLGGYAVAVHGYPRYTKDIDIWIEMTPTNANKLIKALEQFGFGSFDHQILKQLIRRKIKCQDTLWLIDKIIDNSNPQEPIIQYFPDDTLLTPIERKQGLPIGNLTSLPFGKAKGKKFL